MSRNQLTFLLSDVKQSDMKYEIQTFENTSKQCYGRDSQYRQNAIPFGCI